MVPPGFWGLRACAVSSRGDTGDRVLLENRGKFGKSGKIGENRGKSGEIGPRVDAPTPLKYRDNTSGQLAMQMRVFDPHQRSNWTVDSLQEFTRVLPYRLHPKLTSKGEGGHSEWEHYFMIPASPEKTDILKWWKSVSSVLPCLAKQADRMLRILLTTVHVESSFSTYKATRDEQQWSMDSDTHICKMSFAFNGVVPLGRDLIAPMVPENSTKRPPVRRANAVFNATEDSVEVLDSATSAGADRQLSQPAEASRRSKRGKVERPTSSQADESTEAQIPASQSQRVDLPMAEQIPAPKKRKTEAAGPSDQSERTLTRAVNADDPKEQLHNYDTFVLPKRCQFFRSSRNMNLLPNTMGRCYVVCRSFVVRTFRNGV